MGKGYTSELNKITLAYNLAYHIEKAKSKQDVYETIHKILDAFEYKETEEMPNEFLETP
jgi:hypothetical protein